ncbi:MAG: hypothetical protein E7168_01755 [Firmicutes bacterium]|nr:hypothetical protein [Bacillota bacterium]
MQQLDYNQTKINSLISTLDFYKDRLNENLKKKNHLEKYFSLKQTCSPLVNFSHYLFSLLILIASGYVMLNSSFVVGVILFSGILFIDFAQANTLMKAKKELKDNYSRLEYNQALLEKKSLDEIENLLKNEMSKVRDEIDYYKYQGELNNIKDTFFSDSEVTYEEVLEQKEKLEKLFDEFLNEPVDYSKIYFDSSIDNSISYKEHIKKLIKK